MSENKHMHMALLCNCIDGKLMALLCNSADISLMDKKSSLWALLLHLERADQMSEFSNIYNLLNKCIQK